jgi:hypothetical protein
MVLHITYCALMLGVFLNQAPLFLGFRRRSRAG